MSTTTKPKLETETSESPKKYVVVSTLHATGRDVKLFAREKDAVQHYLTLVGRHVFTYTAFDDELHSHQTYDQWLEDIEETVCDMLDPSEWLWLGVVQEN